MLTAAVACASAETTATISQTDAPAAIKPGAFEIRGLKGLWWAGIDKYYKAVEWMPKHGMNWLMLCYTAYPESGKDWRQDYTPQHLAEMRELVTRGNDRGVTICLSFNPGIWSKPPLEHSSEADYQAAWRKVKAAHDIGIYWIGLCLDDIHRALTPADQEKYGTLQAAQVDFTNRLWRDMQALTPRPHLIFCPSVYFTADMLKHQDYINYVGEKLDPQIDIFWTGPGVVYSSITTADCAQEEKWLRRKPFIWDNYPVNYMFGQTDRPWRPILAPLDGRYKELPAATAGILFTPMMQWEVIEIPLVSVADYLRDPRGYDPSREKARILAEYQPPVRDAVDLLMKYYGSAFVGQPGYPPGPAVSDPGKRAQVIADLTKIREILQAGPPDAKQLWEDVKPTVEADLKAAAAQ
jgi:hypothetical protein